MYLKDKLIKEFEETPVTELPGAPVYALQGLSAKDAERLEKAFNVKTIRDLARLKYALWAKEICDLADADTEAGEVEMLRFKERLDKKYEKKTFKALTKAPLDALQGLSKKDAKLLEQAFRIRTIRGLANLKYCAWAREILEAAEHLRRPAKAAAKIEKTRSRTPVLVLILLLLAAAAILLFPKIIKKSGAPTVEPAKKPPVPAERKPGQTEEQKENAALQAPVDKPAEEAVKKEPAPPVKKAEEPGEGFEFYTVKAKEGLIQIAEQLYGDWTKWEVIYKANRDRIDRPNLIYVGQKIRVPVKK